MASSISVNLESKVATCNVLMDQLTSLCTQSDQSNSCVLIALRELKSSFHEQLGNFSFSASTAQRVNSHAPQATPFLCRILDVLLIQEDDDPVLPNQKFELIQQLWSKVSNKIDESIHILSPKRESDDIQPKSKRKATEKNDEADETILVHNEQAAIEQVKKNGLFLQKLPSNFRDNPLVVKEALKNNIEALRFIGPLLKCDFSFFVELINNENLVGLTQALMQDAASDHVRCLLEAYCTVRENPSAIHLLSEEFQKNKIIGLRAVNSDPSSLSYLHPDLKSDREIVEAAIKKDVRCLALASETLRKDKSINLFALRCCKDETETRHFYSAILPEMQSILKPFISVKIYPLAKDVILKAVSVDYTSVRFADPRILYDVDFCMQVLDVIRRSYLLPNEKAEDFLVNYIHEKIRPAVRKTLTLREWNWSSPLKNRTTRMPVLSYLKTL
jgi:hypothetical protein